MSLFKREKWRLDMAPTRAFLSQWHPESSIWQKTHSLVLTDPVESGWETVLDNFLVSLDGRKAELQAVVDNRLARFFFVTPPTHIYRLADLKQVAAIRFKALFGLDPAAWRIEAQWNAKDPFLACALPSSLIDATAGVAKHVHVPLRAFKPEILVAIDACAPAMQDQSGWLVYETDTHAMVAHLQRGQVQWMSQWLPKVSASKGDVITCVKREAVKSGCEQTNQIYLTGPQIQHWGGSEGITALPDNLWRLREAAQHDEASAQH